METALANVLYESMRQHGLHLCPRPSVALYEIECAQQLLRLRTYDPAQDASSVHITTPYRRTIRIIFENQNRLSA